MVNTKTLTRKSRGKLNDWKYHEEMITSIVNLRVQTINQISDVN